MKINLGSSLPIEALHDTKAHLAVSLMLVVDSVVLGRPLSHLSGLASPLQSFYSLMVVVLVITSYKHQLAVPGNPLVDAGYGDVSMGSLLDLLR
jgi:hypothetical protein